MISDEAVEAAAKVGEDSQEINWPDPLEWVEPVRPEGPSCLHQQEPAYQPERVASSSHVCATCGDPFTVTPAVPPEKLDQWTDCLGWQCPSYTPTRDPELLGGITREDEQ